jgi:hypothetical protein
MRTNALEAYGLLLIVATVLAWVLFGAVMVAIRRLRQFSIRDMFVATTAAAVLIWLTIKCLT